ncbi:hypothetical protein ACLBXX_06090 [Microbacterium sp. C23T]
MTRLDAAGAAPAVAGMRRSGGTRTDAANLSEFGGISEFRVIAQGRATDAAA